MYKFNFVWSNLETLNMVENINGTLYIEFMQ